jgi:hypothetical protein
VRERVLAETKSEGQPMNKRMTTLCPSISQLRKKTEATTYNPTPCWKAKKNIHQISQSIIKELIHVGFSFCFCFFGGFFVFFVFGGTGI